MKPNVLSICVHNSARSQMAEAWVNKICGEFFQTQSAGLEPGSLNPLAVEVMREVGIDISKKKTFADGRRLFISSIVRQITPQSAKRLIQDDDERRPTNARKKSATRAP
jgi:protein-tyrosine-phosphatase